MTTEIPLGLTTRKNNIESLSRLSVPLLVLLTTLFWANQAAAATYCVGTCKTGSYSTIMICPGTYAEDLLIDKPLTLQGMRVGDSSLVIVQPASPASAENSIKFGPVNPVISVNNGPVNLSDITIGPTFCPSSFLVDIFYSDGFGTIDHVTTETSNCAAPSSEVAILLENGKPPRSPLLLSRTATSGNRRLTALTPAVRPADRLVNVRGNYLAYIGDLAVAFDCNTAGTATGNFGEVAWELFRPGRSSQRTPSAMDWASRCSRRLPRLNLLL